MYIYLYIHICNYIHILGWFIEIGKKFCLNFQCLIFPMCDITQIIATVNFLKFSITVSGSSSSKKVYLNKNLVVFLAYIQFKTLMY